MLSWIITILAILCLFFDIGYWLKVFQFVYYGKLFQKRYKITDTSVYYGICTSRDVDILLTHMNNARYLRTLDFARLHFCDRTTLLEKFAAAKGQVVVGANTIRYRRALDLFSLYKVETKLLCWDDTALFFEHKVITLKDGFVRAIAITRVQCVKMDLPALMADLPGADSLKKFPDEVVQWQQTLETVSGKLRKKE